MMHQATLFDEEAKAPSPPNAERSGASPSRAEDTRVRRGDVWQLGMHRLGCLDATDAHEVAALLGDEQPDLIFADPPYGIAIDEWDVAIPDVGAFIALVASQVKAGGFFAFTHQMPHMLEWLVALHTNPVLRYKDHIAWIKRNLSAVALPLLRAHESLFIYSAGKADYHQTKGRYEDVKLPGVLVDVITLEAIDRYIKDLRMKANGQTPASRAGKADIHKHNSYQYMKFGSDRSPECTNFTNVWSFRPENQRRHGRGQVKHATAKPVLLMQRLITLCCEEDALVYDAFLGSGTTLIAGQHLGRRVYGCELSPANCDSILDRFTQETGIAPLLHQQRDIDGRVAD